MQHDNDRLRDKLDDLRTMLAQNPHDLQALQQALDDSEAARAADQARYDNLIDELLQRDYDPYVVYVGGWRSWPPPRRYHPYPIKGPTPPGGGGTGGGHWAGGSHSTGVAGGGLLGASTIDGGKVIRSSTINGGAIIHASTIDGGRLIQSSTVGGTSLNSQTDSGDWNDNGGTGGNTGGGHSRP